MKEDDDDYLMDSLSAIKQYSQKMNENLTEVFTG